MKRIKSIFTIALLLFVVIACEKNTSQEELSQAKPSFTIDGLTNTVWEGTCDAPYNIVLYNIVDLGGGKYQWQWGIANLYGAPDLSRISFEIPSCVTVESPKFAFQNQLQQTATVVTDDGTYANCRTNPATGKKLYSFVIPTVGTGVTYFYLTMNTNKVAERTAYFQNSSGCGSTCFPGIKDECSLVSCSYSQGRYFAKPEAWPAPGTVVVGGKTYTEAEGRAIWDSKNSGGISDAKKAFHQVAAIKLSSSTISSSASVWADVKIIEDWLATLPKLTPTNHYSYANKAAADAAGRIGTWIDNNHCK